MNLLRDLFINLCVLGMVFFTFHVLTGRTKGFISPAATTKRKLGFALNMGLIGVLLMYLFDGHRWC
jgi:hypothetical protein